MLRSALFIARKDVEYLLRKRETLLWVFVMPIVFFYFIGTTTAGFGGGGVVVDRVAVRVPESAGFLADALLERLEAAGYRIERPDSAAFAAALRRLEVPPHFTDSILAGRPVELAFRRRGGGIANEYDVFRVRRGTYGVLADMALLRLDETPVTAAGLDSLAALPRHIQVDVRPAGRRAEPPTGFAQAIPGTMVMFTLLVMLTSGAVMLVVERREGMLRRLAATPIPRGGVVLGKWLGRMALGIVQIGFAMLAGALMFRMDWGPHLGMVLAVMIVYAGFVAVLGLLLGTLARSEGQAVGIGVLCGNVLAALGGCWWPIEVTPQWMQGLALFLPTGIAMDALHKLVSFQLAAPAALPHVAVLAAAGLVAGWAAARLFRYQ